MTASLTDSSLLRNNINARIVISYQGSDRVTGFIQDNFTVDGSADYTSLFDPSTTDRLNETIQRVRASIETFTGISFDSANVGLKNTASTQNLWVNSSRPRFNIPMTFVALDENDDVRKTVLDLYRTVYPEFVDKGETFQINPPLNYLPTGKSTARGTITVKIGRWFQATQQVMRDVSFNFSKEVISNGSPLYATGTISFEPFRVISFKELQGYFQSI